MNQVTKLSREIVTEIQLLTNRCISVDEYLKIRDSAVFEIQNGLYKESATLPPSYEKYVSDVNDTNLQESISNENIKESRSKGDSVENKRKFEVTNIDASKQIESKKDDSRKVMPWETTDTIDNTDDSDFFAMCNRHGE